MTSALAHPRLPTARSPRRVPNHALALQGRPKAFNSKYDFLSE